MRQGRNKDRCVIDGLLRSTVHDLTFDDARARHHLARHAIHTDDVPAFLARAEEIEMEISARRIASTKQRHADPPFLHNPVSAGELTKFYFATRADNGEVLREV